MRIEIPKNKLAAALTVAPKTPSILPINGVRVYFKRARVVGIEAMNLSMYFMDEVGYGITLPHFDVIIPRHIAEERILNWDSTRIPFEYDFNEDVYFLGNVPFTPLKGTFPAPLDHTGSGLKPSRTDASKASNAMWLATTDRSYFDGCKLIADNTNQMPTILLAPTTTTTED